MFPILPESLAEYNVLSTLHLSPSVSLKWVSSSCIYRPTYAEGAKVQVVLWIEHNTYSLGGSKQPPSLVLILLYFLSFSDLNQPLQDRLHSKRRHRDSQLQSLTPQLTHCSQAVQDRCIYFASWPVCHNVTLPLSTGRLSFLVYKSRSKVIGKRDGCPRAAGKDGYYEKVLTVLPQNTTLWTHRMSQIPSLTTAAANVFLFSHFCSVMSMCFKSEPLTCPFNFCHSRCCIDAASSTFYQRLTQQGPSNGGWDSFRLWLSLLAILRVKSVAQIWILHKMEHSHKYQIREKVTSVHHQLPLFNLIDLFSGDNAH